MADNSLEDNNEMMLNPENWLKEFEHISVHEEDLNKLLMNFFCVHRMYDVAEEFQKEANIKPDMPIETIKIRYLIQNEIMNNNIEKAIEHINTLDQGILKKHKDIVFYLKKQQLLKMILNNNVDEAIAYSQQELAPFVIEKPSLIKEIDDVMMLMAYSDFEGEKAKKLIEKIEKKKNTLKRIDDIILKYYNVDSESTLEYLAKNVSYTQERLSSYYPCGIPMLKNFRTAYIEYTEKPKRKKKKKKKKQFNKRGKNKKTTNDNNTEKKLTENPKSLEGSKEEYRSV